MIQLQKSLHIEDIEEEYIDVIEEGDIIRQKKIMNQLKPMKLMLQIVQMKAI